MESTEDNLHARIVELRHGANNNRRYAVEWAGIGSLASLATFAVDRVANVPEFVTAIPATAAVASLGFGVLHLLSRTDQLARANGLEAGMRAAQLNQIAS